jgi:hypothetical protein
MTERIIYLYAHRDSSNGMNRKEKEMKEKEKESNDPKSHSLTEKKL